jgi:hydroxymethylpyrimidine/phosphomethylpyrimidine kinase
MTPNRPAVLIFAGVDPSGGAGIAADILAVSSQGAHALPVVSALTVQDNDRVFEVAPVTPELVARQAQALIDKGIDIGAVKIGIPGNGANARAIAEVILALRRRKPDLPVVLDPVLSSGHGDALSRDDAVKALAPLLALATLVVPNSLEARRLTGFDSVLEQAAGLHARGCRHVLITGGHDGGAAVVNRWFGPGHEQHDWSWPRLPGGFHGSGCTLASAIAARLAQEQPMAQALAGAQAFCHQALATAYPIADGQLMPRRC